MADSLRNTRRGEKAASATHVARSGTEVSAPRSLAGDATRYRPLHVHAAGGVGEVLIAEDIELGRQVALKQIKAQYANDVESQRRFLTEAEVTGCLEHPGIVPVYGLGVYADGRPYYAMRFIRGESFEEAIEQFHKKVWPVAAERNLALRNLLGRFIDVCDAVGYAHSRGVLHRDLKPANVMLGPYGETLIVDWGLAKSMGKRGPQTADSSSEKTLVLRSTSAICEALAALGDEEASSRRFGGDSDATQEGAILGTPAFMSPEQATGSVAAIGPATDIYSLGAIVYFLLTGMTPFKGRLDEVLNDVENGDFPTPRSLQRGIHPALEAICLKAMSLRPEDRYATCRDMAGDMERWLADEPVSAYAEPAAAALRRWARKHQKLVLRVSAGLLVGVVVLTVGLIVATVMNGRLASAQRKLERANVELSEKNTALEAIAASLQRKLEGRPGTQPSPR